MLADGVPDAVFAGNDQMALGFLHAAAEAGLSVPRDVSLVGFDDLPEAAHFSPPLTTVRQDFTALGQDAIRAALEVIKDDESSPVLEHRVPQLVVRSSTRSA